MTARKPKPKPRGPCRESEHAWVTDGIGPTQCRKCGAVPHPNPLKPKPRKASGPTLEQLVARLEKDSHPPVYNHVPDILARLDALETRKRFRDKSHDEPVSNAGEAIGQHFRIIDESHTPWWRRFLNFMGAA